jgi:CheY-like chemotaxis protein
MTESADEVYTVLYVEDNSDNILLVQKILEKRNK